ncbi:hypothetical protein ACQPVP_09170 [Clostridium nigeriense]
MEEKNNMSIIYYGSYTIVDEPSIIKGIRNKLKNGLKNIKLQL